MRLGHPRKDGEPGAPAAGGPGGRAGWAVLARHPLFHVLLLGALVALPYANTIRAPFAFDDYSNIVRNPLIRDLDYYVHPSKAEAVHVDPALLASFRWRFVTMLTFALNYRWNGIDASGYHAVNLAIHVFAVLLVYLLVRTTLGLPSFAESPLAGRAGPVALFSAALFAAHPIETQAVTYVVQRMASLAGLLCLVSLVCYVHSRVGSRGPVRVACYLASVSGMALAMKAKQSAFTFPLVLVLYEHAFLQGKTSRRWAGLAPLLLTMLIVPWEMLGGGVPTWGLLDAASEATKMLTSMPRLTYLFTQFRVIVTYLRLLVLPVGQNLDHDYPIYESFAQAPVALSCLFLVELGGLGIALFLRRRPRDAGLRLVGFGILWFFLALAVESSVVPILDVMFEHRVYLPSVGFFLAVSAAGGILARRTFAGRGGSVPTVAALLVVLALSVATHERNRVWGDAFTLWQDAAEKSPNKARPNNNYASELADIGRAEEAIPLLRKATRLDPLYFEAHSNLGAALGDVGRPEEGVQALRTALAIKPDYPEAYYNLGRLYLTSLGRYEDAIASFERSIEINPSYTDAQVNLAAAYVRTGMCREAVDLLERVPPAEIGERPDAHLNLGSAYACTGDTAAARREVEILKKIGSAFAEQLEGYLARSGGGNP